ncbi:hypothetical protein [Legionella brunensis]|uniref:DUF2383 domain-containing protein n=1 Tax=Legionella brunensis TaxID=29422 RepID=A0A0W0S3E9_9GAMM|nr:hypothetical protein [Legionella brunensis]KTC78019.1 hypothetical protein Lbru_2311 [Legionella brunensis]
MATLVGTQMKFEDALYELCELDYDVVEAYETAINRIDNETYKNRLTQFKIDHEIYIKDITNLLKRHKAPIPEGPSAKQLLVEGKVIFANLFGDEAILRAILANEIDINTAFERLSFHETKWKDASDILARGLDGEKKHRHWFEAMLETPY